MALGRSTCRHPQISVAWLCPLLGAFFGITVVASGQQPTTTFKFIGVRECERCHTMPTAGDIRTGATNWVRLNEYSVWSEQDKHSKAHELLTGDRGKQIGQALWKNADVTARQECISCHSNWHKDLNQQARYDERFNEEYERSLGVTCESCHGPGSAYEKPHQLPSWRVRTAAQRRDEFGMVNVRDPRERARQCLSCHIGNAEEGKLLTHDMYAAGHPPLPSIEIETFAQHMPPHWRTLNEKVADLAKLSPPKQLAEVDKIRELLHQPASELHGVKSVLVAGVVNLREAAHLVGQQAAAQDQRGPEFALFDCAMCHHDLRTPSWRQARMVGGRLTPGRPQLHRWPAALVDVALIRAAKGDPKELTALRRQFADKQSGLQTIFNRSPFGIGRGAEVAAASTDVAQWLDGVVERVSAAPYDRAASEAVLLDLCRSAKQSEYLDYDSARQLAWAIRSVWQQLQPPPGDRAAASQILDEINQQLRLELPWGQAKKILDPTELEAAFTATSTYDPKRFQQQIGRLLAALGMSVN